MAQGIDWTPERRKLLEELWGRGAKAAKIGVALGCFATYKDKGRSAVCSKVRALREEAQKNGDMAKAAFWSRKSGHAPKRNRGAPSAPLRLAGTQFGTPLSPDKARQLVESVAAPVIKWPSTDEINDEARRQICAAADKM